MASSDDSERITSCHYVVRLHVLGHHHGEFQNQPWNVRVVQGLDQTDPLCYKVRNTVW